MSFLKLSLLSLGLSSGVILLLIFLFSHSEDQGLLSNKMGNFMPGSFDAVRNKILATLSIIFVSSILTVSAIEYRRKKIDFSTLDQLESETQKSEEQSDGGAVPDDKDYE
ncbi:MAG: hypothetical protein JJW01_03805 [Alphaproteobacteria bacterium]|nr:hypothetical protein [Rickettsiales bacterium]